MNNQNNISNEPNNVSVNGQTTGLPQSQVVNNTINNNQQQDNNNQKDGCFKYLLAFIFLIGMILVVFFLPQISEYLESKKKGSNNTSNAIQNGTLVCNKKSTSDIIDVNTEMKINFTNQKIIDTTIITETQSSDNNDITNKKSKCDNASKIAESIDGLEMSCTLASTVLTVFEKYNLKQIDLTGLTKYTEASGTYPEFKYGENVYDAEKVLRKKGYECSVKQDFKENENN